MFTFFIIFMFLNNNIFRILVVIAIIIFFTWFQYYNNYIIDKEKTEVSLINYTKNEKSSEESLVYNVFESYINWWKNCDIELAYKIISEKSKEIVHFTCQNYKSEVICYESKDMNVKIKDNKAIIYRVPFSHKVENPVFFIKEDWGRKIEFSKMAFWMTMLWSTCDSWWWWRNQELAQEFCSYFEKWECPDS